MPLPDEPSPGCIAAILPAGGSGQRFGAARNKLFSLLGDRPIWYHAASRLRDQPLIGRIVMAVSDHDRPDFQNEYAVLVDQLRIELVSGGEERTQSVRNALDSLTSDESVRYVAVHDAARPLVIRADLDSVFAMAVQTDAALLATPMPGSVKRGDGPTGEQCLAVTVDRRDLWLALTPQVFRKELLVDAYKKFRGRPATDDAELVERLGKPVTLVHGSAENIKITLPEDLLIAHAILQRQSENA